MLNFKNLALVATTALTIASAPAFASEGSAEYKKNDEVVKSASNSGFYATVGAGIDGQVINLKGANTKKKTGAKVSPTLLVGIGAKLADNFRADLTLNFTPSAKLGTVKNPVDGSSNSLKLQNTALFANGYYHFTDGSLSPYAMAGLGISRNNLSVSGFDKTKTNFAWQIGAGVTGDFSENLAWDVGYRFVNNGKYSTKGLQTKYTGLKVKSTSHLLLAGIRVGL